jgi:hypothetical protein
LTCRRYLRRGDHHEKYGHQLIWAKQTSSRPAGAGRCVKQRPVATGDGIASAFGPARGWPTWS